MLEAGGAVPPAAATKAAGQDLAAMNAILTEVLALPPLADLMLDAVVDEPLTAVLRLLAAYRSLRPPAS